MDSLTCFLILDYVDPRTLFVLARVSKEFNTIVRTNISRVIPVVHSHVYRGKETCPSDIELTYHNRLCFYLKRCAVCKETFRGGFSRYGVYGHKTCIRQFLVNTYYLEIDGIMEMDVISRIPHDVLVGFRPYSREQYTYNVVWEKKHPSLIHDYYTLEHLIQSESSIQHRIQRVKEEKRRQEEAEERKQQEKTERLDRLVQKRHLALVKRLARLDAWAATNGLLLPELEKLCRSPAHIYGDFKGECKLTPSTALVTVEKRLLFLHQLYQQEMAVDTLGKKVIESFLAHNIFDADLATDALKKVDLIRNTSLWSSFVDDNLSPPLSMLKRIQRLLACEKSFSDEEIERMKTITTKTVLWNDKMRYILEHPKQGLIGRIIQYRLSSDFIEPFLRGEKKIFPFPTKRHPDVERSIDMVPVHYKISSKNQFDSLVMRLLADPSKEKKQSSRVVCPLCRQNGSPTCTYFMCSTCCPKDSCVRHCHKVVNTYAGSR